MANLVKRFSPVLTTGDVELGASDGTRADRTALRADAGAVIGVDIGRRHVAVSVRDLFGRPWADNRTASYFEDEDFDTADADHTLAFIVQIVNERIRELGLHADDVVGVGVGLGGPLDLDKGVMRASHDRGDSDWQLLSARDHLQRELGWFDVPFFLDNDANLAALAEHTWGAGRSRGGNGAYENMLYIEWSRGIGAGIVLNGQLYCGEGAAGEIGHTTVRNDGPVCDACGRHGCLEAVAGWSALQETHGWGGLGLADVVALGVQGDADVKTAFGDAARDVARALGPAIHLLNPQLAVVGGAIGMRAYDLVRSALRDELKSTTMRPALEDVSIVRTQMEGRTALQGAIASVLRDDDALLVFLHRRLLAQRAGAS